MDQWILQVGSFDKGFVLVGPFDSWQKAMDYADGPVCKEPCKIIKLEKPISIH